VFCGTCWNVLPIIPSTASTSSCPGTSPANLLQTRSTLRSKPSNSVKTVYNPRLLFLSRVLPITGNYLGNLPINRAAENPVGRPVKEDRISVGAMFGILSRTTVQITGVKSVRHDGIGSISFGGPVSGEWRWGRNNLPRPPTFDDIDSADSVYQIAARLREQAQKPTSPRGPSAR
jgi:hypothetical protein